MEPNRNVLNLMLGLAIGFGVSALVPAIPQGLVTWMHEVAEAVAIMTDTDRDDSDALTNWRQQ